ncbi:MAG: cytochrome c3 family protein [Thermincolia bacterium]
MSYKRISLILALSLAFVLTFAATALAAQISDPAAVKGDAYSDYLATPKNTTNGYPNGIYLQDQNSDGVVDDIHSNYQRNTDACASCHATHTGVGASLLQWASVTETCNACHDGTIAQTYDVMNGQIAATGKRTFGGVFMEAVAEGTNSLSRHSVGTVNINAAPGGAGATAASDANGTKWGKQFECTSCHTPHGQGGNFRILSPDVNGLAMLGKKTGVALTTLDNLVFTATDTNWIAGFPYSASTKIYVNGVVASSTTYTIDYKNGKVTFNATQTGAVTADYVPAVKVTATVTGKLTAAESVAYGEGFNKFCGACHTDYATANVRGVGKILTGTYKEAYRHRVGYQYSSNKAGLKFGASGAITREVNCMTCHVAHGTDQQWWTDWKTTSGWQGNVTGENAGSSALKRLPNMSTCEACHAKGAGNYSY